MSTPIHDHPLFFSSLLLFSDQDMARLADSTVGVVGVGGVGAVALEMLCRAGVGAFRIADRDVYGPSNLNRQLFATRSSLGRDKAQVAAERAADINPGVELSVFSEGLTPHNLDEFCQGVDLLVSQPDRQPIQVLLHRAARRLGIPVVSGARAGIRQSRWKVRARVWNYRDQPDRPGYDEVYHPQWVGLDLASLPEEELDRMHAESRQEDLRIFAQVAHEHPEHFPSISAEALAQRIASHDDYANRHVCSVLANTAGTLCATVGLKVLLGGPSEDLEIDLWP